MKWTLVALYVVAALLEVAAVGVTVRDIRDKSAAAKALAAAGPPAASPMEVKQRNAAGAMGVTTYGQLQHVGGAALVALASRALAWSAVLLVAGIAVGAVADVLAVTRG